MNLSERHEFARKWNDEQESRVGNLSYLMSRKTVSLQELAAELGFQAKVRTYGTEELRESNREVGSFSCCTNAFVCNKARDQVMYGRTTTEKLLERGKGESGDMKFEGATDESGDEDGGGYALASPSVA